ncbi:unnamed protein product [Arctia plantaginis]|uniref:Uncharacterized protein n=1 Tax=Arctia plantaginis TaxID=874455 RepID=A0A8S1ARF4_ARCPL|nr:unnamed protein product [Arctia plantaginis]
MGTVFGKKLDYTTTVKINRTRVSSSQRREIKSSTEAQHEAARATAHQTGCGTGRRTHARAQCAHPSHAHKRARPRRSPLTEMCVRQGCLPHQALTLHDHIFYNILFLSCRSSHRRSSLLTH